MVDFGHMVENDIFQLDKKSFHKRTNFHSTEKLINKKKNFDKNIEFFDPFSFENTNGNCIKA